MRRNRGHHHRQRLRGDRRPPQEVNQRVTATLFVATSLEQASKQPLTQNALYTVFSRLMASVKTMIFELFPRKKLEPLPRSVSPYDDCFVVVVVVVVGADSVSEKW